MVVMSDLCAPCPQHRLNVRQWSLYCGNTWVAAAISLDGGHAFARHPPVTFWSAFRGAALHASPGKVAHKASANSQGDSKSEVRSSVCAGFKSEKAATCHGSRMVPVVACGVGTLAEL